MNGGKNMGKEKNDVEATGRPVVVVPFGEITIHGPSGDNVLLLVYDPITNGIVGIDASYVDQASDIVKSPYSMHNSEMLISTKGRDIEHIDAPRFGLKGIGEDIKYIGNTLQIKLKGSEEFTTLEIDQLPVEVREVLAAWALRDQWIVKTLTLNNIETLAEEMGISMDRITSDVISVIVHSVEKGVDAALENWGDIVREAIEESVPDLPEDNTED